MLLELALGGELFSLLQKKAPLPDLDARFYVAQVVAVFAFMQSHKVVHRNLSRPSTRPPWHLRCSPADLPPEPPPSLPRWCTATSSRRTCCSTRRATSR